MHLRRISPRRSGGDRNPARETWLVLCLASRLTRPNSIREMAVGVGLRPGWVAMSYFWLIEDHVRLVGVSRLRPKLTPAPEIQGGHIGYDVPPSVRRRGCGTQLL